MKQFNKNWDGVRRNHIAEAMAQYEANSRYPMSNIGNVGNLGRVSMGSPMGTPAKSDDTSNSEANAKTFVEILCQRTGKTGMVFRLMTAGHPMHFLQMEKIPTKNGETEQSYYVFFEMKHFHGGLADKMMAGRGTFVRRNNGADYTDMMFAVQDVSMARTKWETLKKSAIWEKTMATGRV
jgi:hypothetical protein